MHRTIPFIGNNSPFGGEVHMSTLQQQIRQLALQLEQLASQVGEPVKEQEIDFQKILLEAQQFPFQNHLVAHQDHYIKTLYLQMLLSVIDYVESEKEERYRLAARIYFAFQMPEDFYYYVQKSQMVTLDDTRHFYQMIKENGLVNVFLIDVLMLLGIKQEKDALQYVSDLASNFDIRETHFQQICRVVVGLLMVDDELLYQNLSENYDLQKSALHYLAFIQSPFSEDVFIEGNNGKVIYARDLKNAKNIYLKNVHLVVDDTVVFNELTNLVLENVHIRISNQNVSLTISNVKNINFHKVKMNDFELSKAIVIENCGNLLIDGSEIENGKVFDKKYIFKIINVESVTISNNLNKNINFFDTSNTIIIGMSNLETNNIGIFQLNSVSMKKIFNNRNENCSSLSKGGLFTNGEYTKKDKEIHVVVGG